jgi:hypothetical protein
MQSAQLRAASDVHPALSVWRGEDLPNLPMNLIVRRLQRLPILPPVACHAVLPLMPLSSPDSPRVRSADLAWIRSARGVALAIGVAALSFAFLLTVAQRTAAQSSPFPVAVTQSSQNRLMTGPALNAQNQHGLTEAPPHSTTDLDATPTFGPADPGTSVPPAEIGPPLLVVTGYEVSPVVLPVDDTLYDATQSVGVDDPPIIVDQPPPALASCDAWHWQLLPDGLIYRSYLAGFREPRMHSLWAYEDELGVIWDIALGGRVGLLRYGTCDNAMPDGWQIDMEGAAFPRLDPEEESDLVAADFRAGVPLTYGNGPIRTKLAYYHLSSHLGDEYLLKNPTVTRYNYSRDVLVLGQSFYLNPDLRIYAEAGWAFVCDVSEEWEFQFGVDYSPLVDTRGRGAPFMALNGHLREEVDFGGNFVFQVGWQWRQAASGHLLRLGLEYFNGKSDQFEFFERYENKVGLAIWYDY